MTITKYPQSCVLIATKWAKILIDPGNLLYTETIQQEWSKADVVLVTHSHPDHCFVDALQKLQKIGKPIYSTQEVQTKYPQIQFVIIQAGDILDINGIKVEVVLAKHGFINKEFEITQNVGYIIDDGTTRAYETSDCIRFEHNYKADVLLANVCAFDASMNLFGAIQTYQEIGASQLVIMHQEGGRMFFSQDQMIDFLHQHNVNYCIPKVGETINLP